MPHNGSCIVAPTNTDVSVKGKRDYISLHTACAPKSDAVLRLKAGDNAPSVFITPGLGGDIAGLSRFISLIRTPHAIYGIQPNGQYIEDIAEKYLEAITRIQPNGPYVLVGFSFGGLVMLEVGRRLLQRGEKIALLALLESYPHSRYWSLKSWIQVLARRTIHHALTLTDMPVRRAIPRIRELFSGVLEYVQIRRGRSPRKYSDLQPEHEPLLLAWAGFRPSYYPGKITFLQSGILTNYPNPISVWGNLAQELENSQGSRGPCRNNYVTCRERREAAF